VTSTGSESKRPALDLVVEGAVVHSYPLDVGEYMIGRTQEADIADRASIETERSLELRTRDRARKLISKIDEALERINSGSYGYCEETAEPISLNRLEARPIATLSLEAQERHERMEKTHRDD